MARFTRHLPFDNCDYSLVISHPVWSARGLFAHLEIERRDDTGGPDPDVHIVSLGDYYLSDPQACAIAARNLDALLAEERVTEPESFNTQWIVSSFVTDVMDQVQEAEDPIDLRSVEPRTDNVTTQVDDWPILTKHPTVLFGDGGTAKSYLALYVAGRLAQQGLNVLYLDWELNPEDHRGRIEALFGTNMPQIFYRRCREPLRYLVNRLQNYVREHRIDFLIIDSVAVACGGPPETSEAATQFFANLREIHEGGSLSIAHQTKAGANDDKPFGSAFWAYLARATWKVTKENESKSDTGAALTTTLVSFKANLGGKADDLIVESCFEAATTTITISSPEKTVNQSETIHALRVAGHTVEEVIATMIEENPDAKPKSIRSQYDRQVRAAQKKAKGEAAAKKAGSSRGLLTKQKQVA